MDLNDIENKLSQLTRRQKTIVDFLVQDKDDTYIASRLKINEGTVRKHIQNICEVFEIKKSDNKLRSKRRKTLLNILKYIKLDDKDPLKSDQEKFIYEKELKRTISHSEVKTSTIDSNKIKHNLPRRNNILIGRKKELNDLLKFISLENRTPIISVDGIGGVGKTALVLEAAYKCLEASHKNESNSIPKFDVIVFCSAKENYLLPEGIYNKLSNEIHNTLQQIFRQIALTLNNFTIEKIVGEKQQEKVYDCLKTQRSLIIVDNMETINDRKSVISFLSGLPLTSKAVITTRERMVLYGILPLESLPEEDSLQLIYQQANQKCIEISEDDARLLHEFLGGIPVALIYAVGQIAYGKNVKDIVNKSISLPEHIAHFCFKDSLENIKNRQSYKVLMALSMFRSGPKIQTLSEISGIFDENIIKDSLAELIKLSLASLGNDRIKILPLTREFAASELNKNNQLHEEFRDNWISWYKKFANKHGNRDWDEWQTEYNKLESEWSNLLFVLSWCANHDRYKDVCELWDLVNNFSSLYGHWSDRLSWLEWIEDKSWEAGEHEESYKAKIDRSYTLIKKRDFKEAQELLTEVLKRKNISKENFVFATQNFALLKIKQKEYDEALLLIDESEDLISIANFKKHYQDRRTIVSMSLRAEVFIKQERYEEAKNILYIILDKSNNFESQDSKKRKWQRMINIARRMIADIAVIEKDYDLASELLETGFEETERNNDRLGIAEYKRSLAVLEYARQNQEKSHKYAEEAMNLFRDLYMIEEANEMSTKWLET